MNGCLLVHGLTGTPATLATVQSALLAADFRVSNPCLAGHGMTVNELANSTWNDWYETVHIAYQNLRREVSKVYCVGISLGALLCLKLALDEGWGVRALGLIATPLQLSLPSRLAIPAVKWTPLKWAIKRIPKNLEKSVADPEGQRLYEEFSLPSIPVEAIFEITKLQHLLKSELHRITNPILMLHGKGDKVAPQINVGLVKKLVASDIVESVILPRSRHVISMDFDKEIVASSIVDFFKRFA